VFVSLRLTEANLLDSLGYRRRRGVSRLPELDPEADKKVHKHAAAPQRYRLG